MGLLEVTEAFAFHAAGDHNDSYIGRPRCGETELGQQTAPVPDLVQYVARAKAAILEVLDAEHAVVHPELEARISEGYFVSARENIDPHHITTALRELDDAGVISWDRAAARGGSAVETIQPANRHRRGTRIDAAAARKRLLAARYGGWSQGTKRHPHGLIGPAGEAAVRTAILTAATVQPLRPDAGEVGELFGVRLPGPVDSAAMVVPFSEGIPGVPVTLAFEVKNIRSWVYPRSAELYQLLNKASLLQLMHSAQPILPILACRKAHYTTYRMAKQVGFVVIEMQRQFAGDVGEQELVEVRNELHFRDLVEGSGPSLTTIDRLRKTIPNICSDFALTWQNTCHTPGFAALFEALRPSIKNDRRDALVNQLRDVARDAGVDGGW